MFNLKLKCKNCSFRLFWGIFVFCNLQMSRVSFSLLKWPLCMCTLVSSGMELLVRSLTFSHENEHPGWHHQQFKHLTSLYTRDLFCHQTLFCVHDISLIIVTLLNSRIAKFTKYKSYFKNRHVFQSPYCMLL